MRTRRLFPRVYCAHKDDFAHKYTLRTRILCAQRRLCAQGDYAHRGYSSL